MLTTLGHRGSLIAVIACTTLAGLFALHAAPCRANVNPESGLLLHVQPITNTLCETPITDCHDIIRSTRAEGMMDFLIFFMGSEYWPGEDVCIQSIYVDLSWPAAWQFHGFWPCGGAYEIYTNDDHVLHLEWFDNHQIGTSRADVILVGLVSMNVSGPGELMINRHPGQDPVLLRHNCGASTFASYPAMVGAEAGMQCGYVAAHCGYFEDRCAARFEAPELLLTAPAGGAANSSVNFESYSSIDHLCPMEIDTHAPWCTAWIDSVFHWDHARLRVVADAAGLTPGLYETEIELFNTIWVASRCLPVKFAVEESSTPTSKTSWGRIKTLYR